MDEQGVIKSLTLISAYWASAKVPTTPDEIKIAIEAWMTLLGKVPNDEVLQEIAKLSASGREFAPAVGQIYLAIKEKRDKRRALPSMDKTERLIQEITEAYHNAGLPTPSEAKNKRISFSEFQKMIEAAGI